MDATEAVVTSNAASGVEEEERDASSSSELEIEEINDQEVRETTVGVRYFNYRGFTNRVQNDGWDHTIECLMIGSNPREEMMEEMKRTERRSDGDRTKPAEQTGTPAMISDRADGIGEKRNLFRVRIRSAEILRHLAELADWSADLGSASKEDLVFCRPFHAFYYYHRAMKSRLLMMKLRHKDDDENAESKAISEMQHYVTMVEELVVPLWTQFDEPSKSTPKKVSYEEISFLFRPGELVYVPPSQKTTRAHHQSAIQTLFRGYFCVPLDVWYQLSEGGWKDPSTGRNKWFMYCYDYDGEGFRTAWHTVSFDYFQGEREITSLNCYPLKFHPKRDRILEEHIERGRKFKEIAQENVQHLYYSGWNLATGIFEKEDLVFPEPEYVESEVIIDIKEAERHVPEWVNREVPEIGSEWTNWDKEEIFFRIWELQEEEQQDNGLGRCVVLRGHLVMREDGSYYQEATRVHENSPFFRKDGTICFKEWGNEDFALLPRRLFGYVLRERKFMRLNVQNLQSKAESDRITLDDIQIKDSHRKIVRSSVSSHFLRSSRNRSDTVPRAYNPDIIRGKGRGLVILLHGAPGVGKTATAEAVALEFNKPLFPITCGDLGITPDAVEETLKRIFRYAHLWDCILLLDEADVFLTQRDRFNIERNALVSVFLRVLEYYSGILFLTTNRVGALDEAFRSRVHVSLYYPHLSYTDTEAILCNNLRRLPRADALPEDETPGSDYIQVMDGEIIDFIKDEYSKHYQTHRRGPWNGRQIRNAVQIASCIAFHDQKGGRKNLPAVLTREHFKTVHETMTEFDGYMAKAQRVDQTKMAHMQGVRYDLYGEDGGDQEPVEYEGFGGHGPEPQSASKYPSGRGGMVTSNRGRTVPRPAARQQPGPSSGRYSTTAQPATYRSRGQAPYNVTSQAYDELHYEEHATFQREPPARRLSTNDPYSRVQRRGPQRSKQIENQDDMYPDHPEHLSEWADENDHLSEREDDPQIAPRSISRSAQHARKVCCRYTRPPSPRETGQISASRASSSSWIA
ncbi:hypothetical protein P170DRAFT_396969 [Aspergillus steynii IBT 23096]|uniref:AAA+ ATPase domain-containing protein n=1 Tax=Aspergillus steynii IBT 23096 TaxID=1392250 RepID=A0A2I2GM66_9EURO|nr:uncharacterized protein P170DRAFT_396969 [Aspergillus steynii IBT 23096]PLB53966.1 hypothetical protein P170DRAFT_396969 [Aspergillus steynii IBT 23096]